MIFFFNFVIARVQLRLNLCMGKVKNIFSSLFIVKAF